MSGMIYEAKMTPSLGCPGSSAGSPRTGAVCNSGFSTTIADTDARAADASD
jgi:hypothetical protein